MTVKLEFQTDKWTLKKEDYKICSYPKDGCLVHATSRESIKHQIKKKRKKDSVLITKRAKFTRKYSLILGSSL